MQEEEEEGGRGNGRFSVEGRRGGRLGVEEE
jgi:hypothetical protein